LKHAVAEETVITERVGGERAAVICCGHTHVPRVLTLSTSGQTILNPGSVGLPGYSDDNPLPHKVEAGSPHARYAMMEKSPDGWTFTTRIVTYDWEKAAREAEQNDRPDWARPLRTGFYGPL
jgi:diadenosine tetraphosphatase ApaH/serine/threonine PP2A family protein phosphatase